MSFNARADFENWLEYVGIRAEEGTWQQTMCRLIMHQQRDPPMNDVDHVKFDEIRMNSRRCEKCHCGVGSRKGVGTVASASELSKCFLLLFVTIVLC